VVVRSRLFCWIKPSLREWETGSLVRHNVLLAQKLAEINLNLRKW
jgi:hypothetical protein